jgi:2-methylisocitrate lyase-like PEP mutase family enzyme
MHPQADTTTRFLALHHGEQPLLLANAWDVGSAKLLAWLGEVARDDKRRLRREPRAAGLLR